MILDRAETQIALRNRRSGTRRLVPFSIHEIEIQHFLQMTKGLTLNDKVMKSRTTIQFESGPNDFSRFSAQRIVSC